MLLWGTGRELCTCSRLSRAHHFFLNTCRHTWSPQVSSRYSLSPSTHCFQPRFSFSPFCTHTRVLPSQVTRVCKDRCQANHTDDLGRRNNLQLQFQPVLPGSSPPMGQSPVSMISGTFQSPFHICPPFQPSWSLQAGCILF